MVEIGALKFEVIGRGRGTSWVQPSVRKHILNTRTLAAFIPGTFTLVGCGSAAPQKIWGKRTVQVGLDDGQRLGVMREMLVLMHGALP